MMLRLFAMLLASLMLMQPTKAQDQRWESVRIFEIGSTRLYVPVKWIAIGSGSAEAHFKPPYDVKLPPETIFVAEHGMQIGLSQHRFQGDFADRKSELWPDLHVGLVDLKPTGRISEAEFREKYVENSIPKNTIFSCDPAIFGNHKSLGYCETQRMVLNGVLIRYRWSGIHVNPDGWNLMDLRMQKIVEWLIIAPDQRPAVIPD